MAVEHELAYDGCKYVCPLASYHPLLTTSPLRAVVNSGALMSTRDKTYRCYLKEIKGKRNPYSRVFCHKTDAKCKVGVQLPAVIGKSPGKAKLSRPKDIFFRGQFLTTTHSEFLVKTDKKRANHV